jgi:hypothetical protein
MNKSSKNNRCISSHSLGEKLSFGKRLREVWQDLQDDPHWKYEELSPFQLLEKSEFHRRPTDNDELARAKFVLESPATLPSGSQLYCLVYFGSRAAVLATDCSLDRSAASNNSGGDSRHRDGAICAVATSVRIKYQSTHPQFDKRQR